MIVFVISGILHHMGQEGETHRDNFSRITNSIQHSGLNPTRNNQTIFKS